MYVFIFFFFQAEDGIRDADVTGVQTCALPIWILDHLGHGLGRSGDRTAERHGIASRPGTLQVDQVSARLQGPRRRIEDVRKIGRASCRERVEISGVGVSLYINSLQL